MDTSLLEIHAANAGLLAPSAADLMILIENGDADKLPARIEALSRQDYISVLRSVQTLERALSAYALSWKNAEYWGAGCPFPDEAERPA